MFSKSSAYLYMMPYRGPFEPIVNALHISSSAAPSIYPAFRFST